MAKVKIYELAKEYDINSKDIIEYLGSQGIEVKHQSGIEGDVLNMVQKKFGKKSDSSETKKVEKKTEVSDEKKTKKTAEKTDAKASEKTENKS